MMRYSTIHQAAELFDDVRNMELKSYLRSISRDKTQLVYAIESEYLPKHYNTVTVLIVGDPIRTRYACSCERYRFGHASCVHIAYLINQRYSQIRSFIYRTQFLRQLLPRLKEYNDAKEGLENE